MQSAVLFNEKQVSQNQGLERGLRKSATDISIDMDFKSPNSNSASKLDKNYCSLNQDDEAICMPAVIDFHITSLKYGSNGANTPGKLMMCLVYGDARAAVYELALGCLSHCHDRSLFASPDKHCFKLVKSQTLNKLQNLLAPAASMI